MFKEGELELLTDVVCESGFSRTWDLEVSDAGNGNQAQELAGSDGMYTWLQDIGVCAYVSNVWN